MASHDGLDDNLNVAQVPAGHDLVSLATAKLMGWLDYLQKDLSLPRLQRKADEIMDALQMASGLPETQPLAIFVASAANIKVQRLGLGKLWYQKLMSLLAPALDNAKPEHQALLLECLMYTHFSYGDTRRASQYVDWIIELSEHDPAVPITEAMLGLVRLSALTADNEDRIILGEQLQDLALQTGNMQLLGRTFGVMAQWYTYRNDSIRTFQYGQMSHWVGLKINEDRFIITGLHYQAIALRMAENLPLAQKYLHEVTEWCHDVGDLYQLSYINYTWGSWYYGQGDYDQAEQLLGQSVKDFVDRGTEYATALYMHGLVLSKLKHFEEAEKSLVKAQAVWESTQRPFDHLYAKYGLAHVYWMSGQIKKAVTLAEKTLDQAYGSSDPRRDGFITSLKEDLQKYRQYALELHEE
jgi:tetratricopeptide (TPR) repeat protein